ncbi:MAG: acyl-CoA-binding protein [Flavobacteriales bacterium]
MNIDKLEKDFKNAVEMVNNHKEPFPADLLLRLYSYYKVATNNQALPSSKTPLINAFKANAIFQNQNLTVEEAKQNYIKCVNHYFLYRK